MLRYRKTVSRILRGLHAVQSQSPEEIRRIQFATRRSHTQDIVAESVGTGPLGEIDSNHGFRLEPDIPFHFLRREPLAPSAGRGLRQVRERALWSEQPPEPYPISLAGRVRKGRDAAWRVRPTALPIAVRSGGVWSGSDAQCARALIYGILGLVAT